MKLWLPGIVGLNVTALDLSMTLAINGRCGE